MKSIELVVDDEGMLLCVTYTAASGERDSLGLTGLSNSCTMIVTVTLKPYQNDLEEIKLTPATLLFTACNIPV